MLDSVADEKPVQDEVRDLVGDGESPPGARVFVAREDRVTAGPAPPPVQQGSPPMPEAELRTTRVQIRTPPPAITTAANQNKTGFANSPSNERSG